MKFKNVKIGQRFDFPNTLFFGCIKLSARRYAYEGDDGTWHTVEVGTINVEVTGVRDAFDWEVDRLTGPQRKILSN
jgi:hypothetical protein